MKTRSQLIIKLSTIVLLICASYSSLTNQAWAAKMYKWVDADGKISYQDKPPPKSGKLIETSELKTRAAASASPSNANQNRAPVTAYTIANCEACVQLMAFLNRVGIPVVELSLQDREVQSRILSLSGKIAAPTLFIGDALIDDLSEQGLITKLAGAGYSTDNLNPPPTTNDSIEGVE